MTEEEFDYLYPEPKENWQTVAASDASLPTLATSLSETQIESELPGQAEPETPMTTMVPCHG